MRVLTGTLILILGFSSLFFLSAAPPAGDSSRQQEMPLVVPAGVPLRLYLTKRVPKRSGAAVEAKVLEPVYAFDRQVIPAGAVVLGTVSRLQPISRTQRTMAILGGDFTPLHTAPIEFTTLVMPDGRGLPLHTTASLGLNSIVPWRLPKTPYASASQNTGVLGTAKQNAKDAIQGQVDRVKSIPDLVHMPGKKEMVEDYLMAKLPYHPQYVRSRTRFDAELVDPLRSRCPKDRWRWLEPNRRLTAWRTPG